MSEEKPKAKNQIVSEKIDFIKSREWNQFRAGNAAKDLVWKDPISGNPSNLETAYATEKLRNKKREADKTAKPGDAKQGVKKSDTPDISKDLRKEKKK